MKTPEWDERMKQGPVGVMTIQPSGPLNFGKLMGQWFVYSLFIAVFAAYITGRTRGLGAPYLEVFRVSGSVTFCCLCRCALAELDLVGPGHAIHGDELDRRHHLRPDHGWDVRLAMAALTDERSER